MAAGENALVEREWPFAMQFKRRGKGVLMKRVFMLAVAMSMVVSITEAVFGATIRVPQDQPTIQAGINAAVNGDTVLVAPGVYTENLSISGKGIWLKSTEGKQVTTLQQTTGGQDLLTLRNGNGMNSGIRGFTFRQVTGANCVDSRYSGTVEIRNCEFSNNTPPQVDDDGCVFIADGGVIANNVFVSNNGGRHGSGIRAAGAAKLIIEYNTFRNNSATYGAAINLLHKHNAVVRYNVLEDNIAASYAGGIYVANATGVLVHNNTIVRCRSLDNGGGGICFGGSSEDTAYNNIVFDCEGFAIWAVNSPNTWTDYNNCFSNSPGNYQTVNVGTGSIAVDPDFRNATMGDYQLNPTSLCINAGNPHPMYNDSDGSRNDIGAIPHIGESPVAATIRVPQDQPTIQAGIDAAVNGDTVLVAPGVYTENINFAGKLVVLRSSDGAASTTIAAANVDEPTVSMVSGEPKGATLRGFTITGSQNSGIRCWGSSPTLLENVITGNRSNSTNRGAGVDLKNTSGSKVSHNTFNLNVAHSYGPGVHVADDDKFSLNDTICYNLFYDNSGYGAIRALKDTDGLSIFNNTILGTTIGLYLQTNQGKDVYAMNNIICGSVEYSAVHVWNNSDVRLWYNCTFANTVDYNLPPGTGSIFADAQFVDIASRDFNLTLTSPCVNAGNPSEIFNDPDGSRNDIGAFPFEDPRGTFVDCANGDDNATGTFNDPFRTIAQAIAVADTSDTIFVFPGECQEAVVIAKPVNLISLEGPELTTIRGVNGQRCIAVDGVTEDTVRIEGFTITGGNPSQPDDRYFNGGGGILAHYSVVQVDNCIVTGNSTPSAGGGILFRNNTDFRLTNTTICHNTAPSSSGGGLATVNAAGGVIERTTIAGNSAGLNGGGVFFFAATPEYYGMDFIMTNSVVINNLATEGGAGIGARRADVNLRSTIVVNNQRGGGVNDLFGVYASESDLITNNDYNDVWGNVGGLDFDPAIIVGSHSLSVDPQFVGDTTCAATALDFCSKLVDTGDPLILPLAGGGVRSDIGRADVSSSECEYRPNRVWVGAAEYVDCQRLKLPVWIVNDLDTIAAVTTPLNWSHAGLIYDSVRWQNSRVANWEFKLVTANNAARTILLGATRLVAPALLPDSGLFCEVFFHANGIAEGAAICVDSGYIAPGGEFIFSDIYARTLYPGFTTHCFDYWPPCALVIAPNGGEVYVGLNSESVMWRFLDDDADSTAVWLSLDGGATYPRYLGSVAGADTTLTWSVPILWEEDCKVRVKNYRPAGIVEGDVSDNLFSIHSIGDTDCSNRIDIADIVCMINFMFPAGTDPCTCIERARDANCDGRFNISDAVHMVNYIFASGPPPCPDNLPAAKMHRPAVDICRDAAVRGEELTVTIASVFDLAAVEWEIDIPMADVKAVRLGGAAEGMQLYQSRLAGGRLKIGVIDLTGEHSIGAGEVIRIELNGAVDLESISLTGIVVDREAVAYDVSANLKSAARPASYTLEQNQPNPFNPQTTIEFTIVEPGWTEVVVFNVLGEEVRRLMAGSLAAGAHSVTWDSRDDSGASLPSGVYFYRLTSGDFSATRKMLLLK